MYNNFSTIINVMLTKAYKRQCSNTHITAITPLSSIRKTAVKPQLFAIFSDIEPKSEQKKQSDSIRHKSTIDYHFRLKTHRIVGLHYFYNNSYFMNKHCIN